jgi:tRNA-Thr(GGU) m(6)t(6)A37 methyltransferase TsaA
MEEVSMQIIARIRCDFPTKFGIPRQSGIVENLTARIVFEPPYRNPDALRGIDGYSHLWLIWQFSEAVRKDWSPTVRPPRLGGNTRMGVFATRSPFRPNPIGLSSVRLVGLEETEHEGTVLLVEGADLMDGTPIYDIKPYLAFTDSHPDAVGGFTDAVKAKSLSVDFPPALQEKLPPEKWKALLGILAHDPRPSYQHDPARIYGMSFAGKEVKFRVEGETLFLLDII